MVALAGHPETDSADQAAGTGANMTVAPDETAGGCGERWRASANRYTKRMAERRSRHDHHPTAGR